MSLIDLEDDVDPRERDLMRIDAMLLRNSLLRPCDNCNAPIPSEHILCDECGEIFEPLLDGRR